MFTKETAIEYSHDFLKECKKLPLTIDKAILFGSAVRGTIGDYSDIDLALFSPEFTDNILNNLDLIALANVNFPDLDVHTYPTSALYGKGLLVNEIKETGIEISVTN